MKAWIARNYSVLLAAWAGGVAGYHLGSSRHDAVVFAVVIGGFLVLFALGYWAKPRPPGAE